MAIGEVAARLDVPGSTIRYCEKPVPADLRYRVAIHRRFHDRAFAEPSHRDRPGGDPS